MLFIHWSFIVYTTIFKEEFHYFWSDNIISLMEFEFLLIIARAVSWNFHSWWQGALWNPNTTQISLRSSADTLAAQPSWAPCCGSCTASSTSQQGMSTWAVVKPSAIVLTPPKMIHQEKMRSWKLHQRLDLHGCGRQLMKFKEHFVAWLKTTSMRKRTSLAMSSSEAFCIVFSSDLSVG